MCTPLNGNSRDKWHKKALDLLVENNYERVYKTVFIITQDEELSKDATQEAFLTAFSKIDTLKDINKFGSWVTAIVVNLSKDMLRRKIQERKRVIPLYDEDNNIHKKIVIELLNIPEDHYEEQEEIMTIRKCINELDVEERQIVVLKYFGEYSYVQIAKQLNKKESTVRMKALRAREKISKKLENYYNIRGRI